MAERMEEEKRNRIIDLFRQGWGATKIAREVGCGETSVYREVERAGVQREKKVWRSPLSPEQHEEILRRSVKETAASLGREFGVTHQTISKIIRQNGGKVRGRGASLVDIPADVQESIVARHDAGDSMAQLERSTGYTRFNIVQMLRSRGIETKKYQKTGEDHFAWKGGRIVHANGYLQVLKNGVYRMEHRVVIEEYLGRPLYPHETVHHIDGDRTNNAIENLQLRIGKHGKGVTYRCMCCGSDKVEPVEI